MKPKTHQITISNKNLSEDLDFDQVMQLYNHIADEERHFNSIELEYRKLASQWLLVTFGAIGILLGNDFKMPTNFSVWYVIIVICALSAIGILVIFIVDIKAYHGLLHEAFKSGIALEMKYKTILPPIRINMVLAAKDGDIVNWVVLFYFFSIASLVGIATISFYFSKPTIALFLVPFFSLFLLVSLYYAMRIVPREITGLEEFIAKNS
jgi:hypothetical protein